MFYVYVLRSEKTGRRYVGSCEDLAERLRRHNNAESKATRHGVPWLLLHSEKVSTRSAAASKERYYKAGRGRDELDRLEVERSPTMKIITMFAAIILAGALRAQEATDVDLAAKSAQKNTNVESAGARPENVPELSQLDEMFKQTPMGKAADAQRLRVEWRQLKNKVVNDPDLIAIKRSAEAARTDLEKREKLRAYYKLYFARVRQFPMSPEMQQHIDAMQASQLGLTAQSRVRPSPTATPAETN
jgi:putative endonuclease